MIVRFAFAWATLSVTSVILLTVLGGAAFPGYSHTSLFISELGATGAPHEALIRFGGFLPAGVFLCLFVVAAFKILPRSHTTPAFVAAVITLAGLLAMDPGFPYVGVVQRVIEASVLLWVIICAWYVHSRIANVV